GLVPYAGPLVYMLFRPPEYLEDVRERELEIKAMEDRLSRRGLVCPVCRSDVDSSYLVCPICTTKLRQACVKCRAPLEALWHVGPRGRGRGGDRDDAQDDRRDESRRRGARLHSRRPRDVDAGQPRARLRLAGVGRPRGRAVVLRR